MSIKTVATSPILPKNDHYAAIKVLWDADSQQFLEAIWSPGEGEWHWIVIEAEAVLGLIKAGWTCVCTSLSRDVIVDAVEDSQNV